MADEEKISSIICVPAIEKELEHLKKLMGNVIEEGALLRKFCVDSIVPIHAGKGIAVSQLQAEAKELENYILGK